MTMLIPLVLSEIPASPEELAGVIAPIVEGLIHVNMAYLRRAAGVPRLYASGIRYVEDAAWRDIPSMLAMGAGSCHSLVAWRIAELRLRGEQAKIHIQFTRVANVDTLHLQVKRLRPKPHVEDPSKRLGMKT
jgi:hypothetical protein